MASNPSMDAKEYIVLYTHQKTKKSKKWQDGKLKISHNGRIELFDDSNNKVETVYVKAGQIQAGEEIESDRHLITIEEAISKSGDVNRSDQESIRQTSEEKNERIQPACRQPLRKRRMGFTVPRQMNQSTLTAENEMEMNSQCNQTSIKECLNSESRQNNLPDSFETRASLLSSPLFNSKPGPRQLSLQDCNADHQKDTGHDHSNRTEHLPCKSQFQGNIFSTKKDGSSEVKTQGCRDEVMESFNSREAAHTGGKRSASQILALLGKKRNNFQPPVKRTRLDSPSVGITSGYDGRALDITKCDSFHVQPNILKEEDEINRRENTGQHNVKSWTEERRRPNLQQHLQNETGMFEHNSLHDSMSVFSGITCITVSSPQSIEAKTYFQKDCLKVGRNSALSHDKCHQGSNQKNGKDEQYFTEMAEKEEFKDDDLFGKISCEGYVEMSAHCRDQSLNVISDRSSTVNVSTSCGMAYIHRTEEGAVCGDIQVTVTADKWTGKPQDGSILKAKDEVKLDGSFKVKQDCASISKDCLKQGSRVKEMKMHETIEVGVAAVFRADEMPQELIDFDLIGEDSHESKVRKEEGSGMNKMVTRGSNSERGQSVGRKIARDDVVGLRNGQQIPLDMTEDDASETKVRKEEGNGMSEPVDECSTKGREQSVGRRDEDDAEEDVIGLRNGQAIPMDAEDDNGNETKVENEEARGTTEAVDECSTKGNVHFVGIEDTKHVMAALEDAQLRRSNDIIQLSREAGEFSDRSHGGCGKRMSITYPDGNDVDEIKGKLSIFARPADNLQASNCSKDLSCVTFGTPSMTRVNIHSEEQVTDGFMSLAAESKNDMIGSFHNTNKNSACCLDVTVCDVSISDADQEDGFNEEDNGAWSSDTPASSCEPECAISPAREVVLVVNRVCPSSYPEDKSGNTTLQNRNEELSLTEGKNDQVPEPLQSAFVSQSTFESEESEDSPFPVSSEEEPHVSKLNGRGELYLQSQKMKTTHEVCKGVKQFDGGTRQLKFGKNYEKGCNFDDASDVAISSENDGRQEGLAIYNHHSRSGEHENVCGGSGSITKQGRVSPSMIRSKLSTDREDSPSDGLNSNSQNSLLSVTTTDTLDSSLPCSQQNFSGLQTVTEAVKSRTSVGEMPVFCLRDKSPCWQPEKDGELELIHKDEDRLTNSRANLPSKKSETVVEEENCSEHDVLEMLKACLDGKDSSEMPVSPTRRHPQVLNRRSEIFQSNGIHQLQETPSCIQCQPAVKEAWSPASPKTPLLSDYLERSVVSSEDAAFNGCQPTQIPPSVASSSKEAFPHRMRDGDTYSGHHLKKELASPSALQKVASSLPDSAASSIHLHKKNQTHYWYQPLASNVVSRRPLSPTVTFASTCRTGFPSSDLRSSPDGNTELQFLREVEDENIMSHHDSFYQKKWDFQKSGIPEVENRRSQISQGMKTEVDAANGWGDNKFHTRGAWLWPSEQDGKGEDNFLLLEEPLNQGDTLDEDLAPRDGTNRFASQTLNEENWDGGEAASFGVAINPRSPSPSLRKASLSCSPDLNQSLTLQSHRDLLQELDADSFAVPNDDDMKTASEVDFLDPGSPVLPMFANVRNTYKNDGLSNCSPFQKVPSSSQEYLSSLVPLRELFFQDVHTTKENELCTQCDGAVKDLQSSHSVFNGNFDSERLNLNQPASKSLLSCQQEYLMNEDKRVAPQEKREHMHQLATANQMEIQDSQKESLTIGTEEGASWSCDHTEPIRNEDTNILECSRGFLDQEGDGPVLDLSQEVDEVDSQMDLFMSQIDEDEDGHPPDSARRDDKNQDETAEPDGEDKEMSESLNSPSFTQTFKAKKKPLVAIATENYQSSQLFVRNDNIEVSDADKDHEYSQSMSNLTGKEEAYLSFESGRNTSLSITQTTECSVGVSANKLENHHPQWNKPSTEKYPGHMTGRRRPLPQMQTSFQSSPSPCSTVSSQGGKFKTPTVKRLHQSSGLEGQINLSGDLMFPSLEDASSTVVPQRQVTIPAFFQDATSYKQVLTAVLREHLNIILFEVAHNFFTALSKVDVSTYSSTKSVTSMVETHNPPCQHKQPSKKVCVKKEGPNKGRFFFTCSNARGSQCKFFQWADQKIQGASKQQHRPEKEVLSDAKSIEMYMKSFGVSLYCECQLLRKSPFSDNIPGAPAWIKRYRKQKLNDERKKLYLKLSRKEGSSVYGKDDLWVISKDLRFDSSQSFLAKSVFHGPNSSSELEIEPLSRYSPSNWPNEAIAHAIHAYNASTELSCLNNIKEFVNPRIFPILPALLNRDFSSEPSIQPHASFKSPAIAPSSGRKLHCSDEQILHLANMVVDKYSLNEDQAIALHRVAEMLTTEKTDVPPVTLIHGVFGAGKSYLLAVTVIFLTQLFQLHQEGGGDPNEWKVLISSTTNVAVDRILLSLLELGFEEFIRVGSMRKIAKPVLPYSVHASDKSNQELKELQEMLKSELSSAEKNFVRKSIERQRLGLNKEMLSKVLVVGVTCAACTFPCIHNLKFPVVLLDECSQITEPACLLPIARFGCQKLVLVGDPKQLDPTIQGSEATHDTSLEQTLFDRLLLMGHEPTLLRTQYRCHPRISAIANDLFYENKLLDGVTEEQRLELAEGFPTLCFYNVANGKECCTTGGSYLNDKEGTFVVTMIEMLVGSGVEPSQIGVITLYKAQVAHVTVLLQQSRLANLKEIKDIQISTVDAFQGGEKDIIILSCVRTDFMGFAASDKRTNVALTRSRNHLLIVGNQKILSANSLWKRVIAKCRECKKGIQDSVAVLAEWAPKLAELRMAEGEKKHSKSKKSKKTSHAETKMLVVQSECAASPPMSLESSVSEQDQSVPEVISVSTPDNCFQEQPSNKNFKLACDTESSQQIRLHKELSCDDKLGSFPRTHDERKNCIQAQSVQSNNTTMDFSRTDIFGSNVHVDQGNVSEGARENRLIQDEELHDNFSDVSKQKQTVDGVSKPMKSSEDNCNEDKSNVSGSKKMLEASLNHSPSYSPLEDGALIESDDSEDGLPNFDFDFEV